MAGSGYTELHKLFVQAMLSRAIVSREGARMLLGKIVQLAGWQYDVKDEEIPEVLAVANRKISSFGMELKEIVDEHNGGKFVVLVNTTDVSALIEKVHHAYTEKERELFRLLLQVMNMDGNYGSLPMIDAMNLPNTGMRPGDIQDTLDKFVSDQWFIETNSGQLIPAPRCIAEFELYFKRNFENYVHTCLLCSNVVFHGVQCPSCENIIHKHCFKSFYAKKKEHKCTQCKSLITPDEHQNGVEEPTQQRKKTGPAKRARTETPQNTPVPSQELPGTSQMEASTPNTRARRKRQSAE